MKICTGLFALIAATMIAGTVAASQATEVLTEYTDTRNGFSFLYPEYWTMETNVDAMLAVIDGPIDLIREEALTESERAGYKILIHVDGNPQYLSNIAFIVRPHKPDKNPAYPDSFTAVQDVKTRFERTMASGTFFLEETYLGDSHTFVYRRNVRQNDWNDNIRITYYITASRTHAYLMMETVLMGTMDDVYRDQFNQVVQSFRVLANESGMIDPSLDWGAFKPGDETGEIDTQVGQIEIVEEFKKTWLACPGA
ncbi:MAG TPA: hypothetical protein ENN67_07880, partial [Firmicutes bacterium]|nr:hypothetical protein [Bacillota bacterium]